MKKTQGQFQTLDITVREARGLFRATGASMATACEALLEILPEDGISESTVNYLTGWLESGLISEVLLN